MHSSKYKSDPSNTSILIPKCCKLHVPLFVCMYINTHLASGYLLTSALAVASPGRLLMDSSWQE